VEILREEVGVFVIAKIINEDRCLKPHASAKNIKRDGRSKGVSYVNEINRGQYPNRL
jgi:hypothetical protein